MDFSEAERKRSCRLNMLIGIVGSVFLVTFGINALNSGHRLLAVSLLLAAALGLGSLILMRYTRDPRFGAGGVSLAAAYVFLYLVVTGGAGGTGPLWCYPLIALVIFLQGLRRGLYVVTGLTLMTLVIFFGPTLTVASADYSTSFKIRFVASFLALALMALIYEYLRAESHSRYLSISNRLETAARTDELTGLANRREMNRLLEMEYARFKRSRQPFSVIMLDLDRFKQLNDRFGHSFGDQVLVEVAEVLSINVRLTDRVSRWGGEEFLILLSQTDLAQATCVAEKLRQAVCELDVHAGTERETLTASLGVQSIDSVDTIEELINEADTRLYQAKNNGRNQVMAEPPRAVAAELG